MAIVDVETRSNMNWQKTDQVIISVLSSLAPPQLVFDRQVIDAAADDYSSVRTAQAICGRLPDCPPTSYGNGQLAF